VFSARLGRRSVPVPTLLRLLYLRHRYQLGYQSLCKEVGDSIAWRRFCRIPLDQPVPHPTTLSKLVGRAGPQVIDQLNHALLAKLAAGKLLRARKLRVDTTVVKADIDDPTDADLLEQAVRISAGWCAASRPTASPPPPLPGPLPAGRRLKQLSHTLRRRTGVAIGEVDRLTAQVATIARRAVGEVAAVQHAAHRTLARRPGDGWARRLTGQLDQTVTLTGRLLDQTAQRLAGNRSIPDRVVSLADRTPARSARASPAHRPSSAPPCCSPKTSAGSSPTTCWPRATRPTRRSCCQPCAGSPSCAGGRRARWSPTAGWGSPPTTARWPSLGSGGSACSAPVGQARPAGNWNAPARSSSCAPDASGSKQGSATSSARSAWAAPGCATWPAPRPGRGLGSSPTTCSA